MRIGWQEIIAIAIFGYALVIFYRRAKRSTGKGGSCCSGSCETPSPHADQQIKITQLHQITVRQTDENNES